EFPHPNTGNYSPTEIVTARSATEMVDMIRAPDFDFTKRVALFAPVDETLVPARDMQMSRIRGGFHVSGRSDGTSLVVLPLQYSHCLRSRDSRVRFVRADLLMAGMIFSGNIDTEILFDYGVFSPGCRRVDLAEFKQLDMQIDLRMPHLTGRTFADWDTAMKRLRAAAIASGLLFDQVQPPMATPTSPPQEAAGPVVTQETTLAELQQLMAEGIELIGIQGLNAAVEGETSEVPGQKVLRLVAVPTVGRHYFATRFTGLTKNRVYRVTAWVKASGGAKVQIEI